MQSWRNLTTNDTFIAGTREFYNQVHHLFGMAKQNVPLSLMIGPKALTRCPPSFQPPRYCYCSANRKCAKDYLDHNREAVVVEI